MCWFCWYHLRSSTHVYLAISMSELDFEIPSHFTHISFHCCFSIRPVFEIYTDISRCTIVLRYFGLFKIVIALRYKHILSFMSRIVWILDTNTYYCSCLVLNPTLSGTCIIKLSYSIGGHIPHSVHTRFRPTRVNQQDVRGDGVNCGPTLNIWVLG